MHTFTHTIEVLRGTSMDISCDYCGGPALVIADTPAGPIALCADEFPRHVVALVQRRYPLTLVVGIH
jgi:hypothetical protein